MARKIADYVLGVALALFCLAIIAGDIAAALDRPTYWRCPSGQIHEGWHCDRVKTEAGEVL